MLLIVNVGISFEISLQALIDYFYGIISVIVLFWLIFIVERYRSQRVS